jgi:hypothetical protein
MLIILPWTGWWDRNLFARLVPVISVLMSSVAMRVVVGIVGMVTAVGGVIDLRAALFRPPSVAPGAAPPEP